MMKEDAKVIEMKLDNHDALTKVEMYNVLKYVNVERSKGNLDCLDEAKYIIKNGDEHKSDVVTNVFNSLTSITYRNVWDEGAACTPILLTEFIINSNIPLKLSNRIKEVATNMRLEKSGQKEVAEYFYKELER